MDSFACGSILIEYFNSAFNYPFQLTLGPVIGAIAAGNTVVIKPSENAPNSAVVIQRIIEAALDPSCYTVIQGGIPETQALLAERWDKIFFTGGATVGRIIAKAAAPHLTPVVLELGGINPAIITKSANPRLVARRLLWGKLMNSGQICTSQNYLLVDKDLVPAVIEEFKKAYNEFYPQGAKASPDYSRIINEGAFRRIKSMLDNTKGKILMGGTMDEKERFIEPTLVLVDSVDDSMLTQESFGPLIPILPVDNLEQAVDIANGIQATPLGLYSFGSKADTEKSMFPARFDPHYCLKKAVLDRLTLSKFFLLLALVVSPSTTLLCTFPPYHSVVSVKVVTAPTVARPASTSSFTVVPLLAHLVGSNPSSQSATHHMRVS